MPTQKPDNEIIRIAESTVNLPSTGKVNKQVPSYELRTVGYDKNYRIFAEELNYTLDNIGQWCQWFENRVDELQVTTEELLVQIEKERVSIGELIEITGDSTNPSILKGYGTWEYFGEGLTTIGVGTHTDDRSEELTFTDGFVFGEYKHVQSVDEVATHDHVVSGNTGQYTHSHNLTDVPHTGGEQNNSIDITSTSQSGGLGVETTTDDTHSHYFSTISNQQGSSNPMNNVQPSVAVYRWKRTS